MMVSALLLILSPPPISPKRGGELNKLFINELFYSETFCYSQNQISKFVPLYGIHVNPRNYRNVSSIIVISSMQIPL